MINILVDRLPETLIVAGREYQIDSSFRAALLILTAFEDETLAAVEKQYILLQNLYLEMPEDQAAATQAAVAYLNLNAPANTEEDGIGRLYSFSKDANLIFAAFQQTHGIDLQAVEMHWWKFMALFMDMGSSTAFCNLVALRRRVKTGKATKEERQAAAEMGETFDVPEIDTRTLEERDREAEFMRLVAAGQMSNG